MAVFLKRHPPRRRQYYTTRRVEPTGCGVVHTTQNSQRATATGVAQFISSRPDPGSYHFTSDQRGVVQVGEFAWTMFGARGNNSYAIHGGIVAYAEAWGTYDRRVESALIERAAEGWAMADAWLVGSGLPRLRCRRITAAEAKAGEAGFVSHAELDPGRRSDPGPGFPWDRFLRAYSEVSGLPVEGSGGEEADGYSSEVAALQGELNRRGASPALAVDGLYGPKTDAVVRAHVDRSAVLGRVEAVIASG